MKKFDKMNIVNEICEDAKGNPLIDLFGLAEVDINYDGNIEEVDKFPPLFVKGTIRDEKNAQLRGLLNAEKTLLTTPYLQVLCSLGYKITRVYQVWEFRSGRCLKHFIDEVVHERRKGDMPNGNPLQANTYKLIGNSFYGGSVMNKDDHSDVCYCQNRYEVCRQINKPMFIDAQEITDDLVELHLNKNKINQNVPIQVGKFILDDAKIHMVNFYYYVIKAFCDIKKIDLISMDTDSFTMAIAGKDLHNIVKDEYKEIWDTVVKQKWFCHEPCNPKTFCNMQSNCNKRIPGPFKEEFSGQKAIGLSSKLYTVTSLKPGGDGTKTAAKGLKHQNMYMDSSSLFEKVFENNDDSMTVTYSSIQRGKESMMTVNGSRTVSNKYTKRRVDDNDPSRTSTLRDVAYCGTPTKKRKLNMMKKNVRMKIKQKLEELRQCEQE